MFKRIQYSMVIEKALLLWEGQLIPIKIRFNELSFYEKAQFREGLRDMQRMGLELHDVAIMIIVQFLSSFSKEYCDWICEIVSRWEAQGMIQEEVYQHFTDEISQYMSADL